MVEKQEHLMIGGKDGRCELCNTKVESEAHEEDYMQSEYEDCDMMIHTKCLERAKMLVEFEWDKDY